MEKILVLLAIGAVVLYFLLRKGRIEALAEQLKAADPSLTKEEATAKAAAQVADQAVVEAQQAEVTAGVEEKTGKVEEATSTAATAQSAAIATPTPEAQKAATDAAAAAEAARKALEDSWRTALTIADTNLATAKTAAETAMAAYDAAAANLAKIQSDMAAIIARVQEIYAWGGPIRVINYVVGSGYAATTALRDEINLVLAPRMAPLYDAEVAAKATVDRVRIEVVSAVASYRLCAERVLTITADLRLLGLLLAEADRLDKIASAAIAKIAEMEAKLK